MNAVEIRLFGGFQLIAANGTPLDVPARKARALLSSLALAHPRPQPRDWLAHMFWGDMSADEQARKSLRQALTALRRVLPEGVLHADRDAVSLVPERVSIDVERFTSLLEAGDHASIEQAIAAYRGDLLEEFSSRVDAFDDWILPKRQSLREQAIEALGRLLTFQRATGKLAGAVPTAIRQVSLDPLREQSHRSLMRLFAEMGRTKDALKQYDACRSALQRALGVPPSVETRDLYEQIRAGQIGPSPSAAEPVTSELRPASEQKPQLRLLTVLAASATDADPMARPGPAFERVVQVVAEYAGHVLRAENDSMLAVFGLTLTKHSDPWRAVSVCRASFDREPSLAVSFGISHAMAMVTPAAEGPSVTGTVLGSAMRLASRARAGELLVSEAATRVLGERASFELVREGPPHLPAEERSYRFLSAGGVQRQSPFVGRARELRVISVHLEECQERGRGSVLILRAEPGMGKTRLIEQVTSHAAALGFATHRATVVDFGPHEQRDTTAALARSLLSDADTLDEREASTPAAAALSPRDEELLWELTGQMSSARPIMGDASSEALSHRARLNRRRELWIALVEERAKRRPTLIAVDDLHWADSPALDDLAALVELVDRVQLVLLITTRYQDVFGNAALRGALRGRPTTTVDLGPFDRNESLTFLEGLEHAPSPWLKSAAERAGGNPLFLAQLLRARSETALPESVQAMVHLELDHLDADATQALRAASVLGQRFQAEAVTALLGKEADFTRALERGLVRRASTQLCFSHALVRDAIYAAQLASDRRELHVKAARIAAEGDPTLSAEHLERAGESSAALALSRAAHHAATQGKATQALELVERALRLSPDGRLRFELTLQRSELFLRLGQSQHAIDACQEALTLAGNDSERQSAWLASAEALRVRERNQEALAALAEAERLTGKADAATLAQLYYLRGNALFPLGDHPACLRAHSEALKHAERSQSPLQIARAQSGLGDAHYIAGRMRTAIGHFRACVDLCDREGYQGLGFANRAMLAIIRFFELEVAEAAAESQRLVAAANEAFDLRAEALALNALLFSRLTSTDYAELYRTAERAIEVGTRANRQRINQVVRMELVWARAQLGEAGDFDREADRIYAQALPVRAFAGLSILGVAVLLARSKSRLAALLDEADQLIHSGQYVSHALLLFVRGAVLACSRCGEIERATGYAKLLERYLGDEALPFGTFYLELCAAVNVWTSNARLGAPALTALRDRARECGLGYDATVIDELLVARSLPTLS